VAAPVRAVPLPVARAPASAPAVAPAPRVAEPVATPPWETDPGVNETSAPGHARSDDRAAPLPTPATAPDRALGDRWAATVQALVAAQAVAALVRELAQQAGLEAIEPGADGDTWCLRVAREPLRAPALADKLQAALAAHLGQPLRLRVEPGQPEDSPAQRDAAERQRRQAAAEATIGEDPVVRGLLQQFQGARIVPGSIKPV
jgi:DNA polymerase III subunit gamma/tau